MNLLQARITFVVLQVLDLLTTLAAFRVGAFEVNPLVAHLTTLFGPVGGLVCSKLIALLLAWWVRKRLWLVVLFYAGIICWNVYVLVFSRVPDTSYLMNSKSPESRLAAAEATPISSMSQLLWKLPVEQDAFGGPGKPGSLP